MRGGRIARGRGRGGRGGSHGRGRSRSREDPEIRDWEITAADRHVQKEDAKELDIDKNATDYFVGTGASFEQHYDGQQKNLPKYLATLATLEENGVDIDKSKYDSICTFVKILNMKSLSLENIQYFLILFL